MGWTLCPIPALTSSPGPAVYLTKDKSGKRLKIAKAAWETAGLKPSDPLLMESDGERYRVRRAEPGEPVYGILSKPASEATATFSSGGKILFAAGARPARVVAVCGDGWIEFDAGPMFDAARQPKPPAPVAVKPTFEPASPPSNGVVKPWRLDIHPRMALEVVKQLVARLDPGTIAKNLGIKSADVLGVRSMVGDAKVSALRQCSDEEREEAYASSLARWTDRVAAREAEA